MNENNTKSNNENNHHVYGNLNMVSGVDSSRLFHYLDPQELKFTESRGELFLDYTTDFRYLLGQVSRFLG